MKAKQIQIFALELFFSTVISSGMGLYQWKRGREKIMDEGETLEELEQIRERENNNCISSSEISSDCMCIRECVRWP